MAWMTIGWFDFGMVRAGENGVDAGLGCGQIRQDFVLHATELGPAVISSADPRLVCHHDDVQANLIGRADNLGRAIDQPRLLDFVQIDDFFDDDPVAIEKERRCLTAGRTSLRPDEVIVQLCGQRRHAGPPFNPRRRNRA